MTVPPRVLRRRGPVDADHGAAIAVLQRQQLFQHPARQAADTFGDHLHADGLQMAQPDFDRRDGQVIQRAVFESGLARGEHVRLALHGGKVDGAAGEPRPPQFRQRQVCG